MKKPRNLLPFQQARRARAHEKLTWRRVDNAETPECFLNKRAKLRQITVADNEFQEAAAAAAAVNSRVPTRGMPCVLTWTSNAIDRTSINSTAESPPQIIRPDSICDPRSDIVRRFVVNRDRFSIPGRDDTRRVREN